MEGPGKSWNFLLSYDAGGRHNGVGVGADAEICACAHLCRVTELLRYSQYIYMVSNFCLSLYLHVADV